MSLTGDPFRLLLILMLLNNQFHGIADGDIDNPLGGIDPAVTGKAILLLCQSFREWGWNATRRFSLCFHLIGGEEHGLCGQDDHECENSGQKSNDDNSRSIDGVVPFELSGWRL